MAIILTNETQRTIKNCRLLCSRENSQRRDWEAIFREGPHRKNSLRLTLKEEYNFYTKNDAYWR